MNTQQLIGWMNDPASAGKDAGAQLDSLTQTFPYFQTAHLLLIKSLHNQNSFLYNNQLKITAAYATNRKVLYELITKKKNETGNVTGLQNSEIEIPKPEVEQETVIAEKAETAISTESETIKPEAEIIQPEFPKKRFVSNPDEWEAGMLRQLQLLHHWKTSPAEEPKKIVLQPEKEIPVQPVEERPIAKTEEPPAKEEPTAADEINTLLYVLVEPDGAEDIADAKESAEPPEENQDWEIKLVQEEEAVAEETTEEEIPVSEIKEIAKTVSDDPVHQEIMLEAISSSIELEVTNDLPKPEDLIPLSKRTKPEIVKTEPPKEEKAVPAEEIQETVSNEEISFSGWLQKLGKEKKATPEIEKTEPEPKAVEPEPKQPNSLIDKFIQEQPRIKGQKNTFYSPVNMAKKSVQENDEFITETLARIYVKQGNISKAIRSYQKLSLKFPEKTAYFAALIEELKRTPK